ncbi:MAG: HAD-IC family P-type ATPase [Alphaproteobacteria bacterium]|nr:HAD-IC family P-type ATPase [Alphaproteobacteria bacterium]
MTRGGRREELPSTTDRGLTQAEVLTRREQAGWNELPDVVQAGPFAIFLRQFSSFLIVILLGAALVAMALEEWIDALAIGLVVLLNAILGFVQEWRAEAALATLKTMMSPKALVIREGQEQTIPARELVPDDLIVLRVGDKVPADAVLVRCIELRVDESVLTGESLPVEKTSDAEDRVFAGTAIVSGHGEAWVKAIGTQTEFGQIAHLTGSVDRKKTNLQRHLGRLATQLGLAALLIAFGIAVLGISVGRDFNEMLMTGLSLSVAIVPEGLPAVVTITLALGAAAMVRQRALARRLQAVETLGAASVICTDKTGTLTENKMTATRIWTAAQTYEVTGTGYDPEGHIETGGRRVRSADDAALAALLRAGLVCSHARIGRRGSEWMMTGEPTEGALVTLAYKGWQPFPKENAILSEHPFTSERKRMSVLYQSDDGLLVLMKGAPETVLEVSARLRDGGADRPISDADRDKIRAAYETLAESGLRVIALAERPATEVHINEEDMTFLGLVGLIDPPRPEVEDAVTAARSAGIRVVMITGDSPVTGRAIAAQVGLSADRTLTHDELETIDDAALRDTLRGDVIFARTRPADKMRIVAALQADEQIVAMTGDGVNDAPALKQADIGVAMGIRGTDVARDASDLVLLDDNFATIVRAIREGRRQFANIRKFVRYLLSSNAGEVVALVINIAVGGPLVFLATQILWMNLVTDGATAVALGLEKSEPDQMGQPPRKKNDPILGTRGIMVIGLFGLYTGSACFWIFGNLMDQGVDLARTTAFTAMVTFEKVSVFAFRSLHLPCWRIGWLSNPFLILAIAVTLSAQAAAVYWPPLQLLLHTVPIGASEWGLIAAFALPIFVVPELLKTIALLFGQRTV